MATPIPQTLSECGYVLATDRLNDRAEHLAAVNLGRAGGRVSTPAKADAARANGALGGRPVGSMPPMSSMQKRFPLLASVQRNSA